MSVEDTRSIDFVSVSDDPKSIHLTISDHLPWEGDHLIILQDKLNAYLDFLDSGEAKDRFPDLADLPIWIDVKHAYDPNEQGLDFLNRVEDLMEKDGIRFTWEKIKGYDEES